MFPFIRFAKELLIHRNDPKLALTDIHVSHHRCWPWDIDMFGELNNGRTLTLYDLGRLPLAMRVGFLTVLREKKWGSTMAGASVRYRRRIRMFERFEMRSRVVCWDERFIYLEQSIWVDEQPASHILYRSAVTDQNGIVSTVKVIEAMGVEMTVHEIPQWISEWIKAEDHRPWPPMENPI